MSQTRENETGRGKPAFWYEPAVSGRTIVDDALSTPHPRAGRRQPVRTPAGHLSTAENGQEPPEGKTPATRENAETAYGKRYVDAVEEQPSPGSGNAHAQRLLELVNPLSLLRKACSAEFLPEAAGRARISGREAAFAGWQ